MIAPDLSQAGRLLDLLEPEGDFCFQTFGDNSKNPGLARKPRGTLDTVAGELTALNQRHAGVFVMVNRGTERNNAGVTGIRALFVDLDGSPIEPVLEAPVLPHVIIESSPGRWHAYWLVDSEFPLDRFTPAQKALAARFDGDLKVHDLARVMRLPGFWHQKAETPFMTRIAKEYEDRCAPSDHRYSVAELQPLISVTSEPSRANTRPSSNLPRTPAYAVGDGAIREGSRNSALTSVAGRLRRGGANEAEIFERIHYVNEIAVSPPLDDDEVAAIARSVSRYEPAHWANLATSLHDAGNGERLIERFGKEVRYVPERRKWVVWNGTHWAWDQTGVLMELSKQTAAALTPLADTIQEEQLRKLVRSHAVKSQNVPRLQAAVTAASTAEQIAAPLEQFDADPMVLGVANGYIDLRDGSFHPPDPTRYILRSCPIDHDPNAKCPQFEKFLSTALGGDKELIAFMQRFIGYSLTGLTNEQCLLFLYGKGSNGKSTLVNTVLKLFGELGVQAPPGMLTARKMPRQQTNDLARLHRARLVVCAEVDEGADLDEALVKDLTGGDTIAARHLYAEFFEFQPEFKLIMCGNHRPVIRNQDDGIWRRIMLVPFNVTIRKEDRDPGLAAKLQAELPGVLNWALAGTLAWLKGGLCPPEAVTEASKEYREEMDAFGPWIEAWCEVDPGAEEGAGKLWSSYQMWCMSNPGRRVSHSRFTAQMVTRFERVRRGVGRFYKGLRVKP